MPDVTLTIEPGVELEFYPSVGILVLGTLHAQGNIDHNIIMRPVKRSDIEDYRIGRHMGNFHSKSPETSDKRLHNQCPSKDVLLCTSTDASIHQWIC